METKFAEIPDALWDQIEPLLPRCPPGPRRGRPPIPDRTILSGIVYRLRTGSQWKALPEQFGSGSACHARFQSWCVAGIFRRLFEKIVEFYDDICGVEWEWASLDSAIVKAPKGGDSTGPNLDKGYDFDDVEREIRSRGIRPHIRRRGEEHRGCRRGRARRWVVERTNAWHNRFRGLLIRWERKGTNYLGLLHLACAMIALRHTM